MASKRSRREAAAEFGQNTPPSWLQPRSRRAIIKSGIAGAGVLMAGPSFTGKAWADSPPAVPVNFVASYDRRDIELSWEPGPGGGTVDHYEVTVSPNFHGWSGGTEYGLGLQLPRFRAATTYEFTCAAVGPGGTSAAVSADCTTPPHGFCADYPCYNSYFAQTALAGAAINPSSATMIGNLCQPGMIFGGLNFMPLVRVPGNQEAVPFSCPVYNGGDTIPLPTGVSLSAVSDGPLVLWVFDGTLSLYELWQTAVEGSGYAARDGAFQMDLTTWNGVFPSPYGLSASGISYGATMITQNDVINGSIGHAMAMQIAICDDKLVSPAVRQDSPAISNPGFLSEGMWLAWPSSVADPAQFACPLEQMVWEAGSLNYGGYGFFVADRTTEYTQSSWNAAGNPPIYNMIQAEDDTEWYRQGVLFHGGGFDRPSPLEAAMTVPGASSALESYQLFPNLPWSDLVLLEPPSL